MFFFKRKPKAAPPRSTAGRLVYAIGDIHGHLDLLDRLLTAIEADVAGRAGGSRPMLIFLGDYVDRGPASAAVVDRLLRLQTDARFETRFLKGNHEEALLRFLSDAHYGPFWTRFGGYPTLVSYGMRDLAEDANDEDWPALRDRFAAALSPEHLTFYRQLEFIITVGDYAFVHAGVRPGKALHQQADEDLLWIRGDFLRAEGPFEKVIVHGHTPTEQPEITPHRIGLDTGAYKTGVLTAARLEDGAEPHILQASRG